MNKRNLEIAGKEYVGDWLCWNEKQLSALPTEKEKREYIHTEGNFESAAGDMAEYDDNSNPRHGIERDCAADCIYEGMCKAVKKFLSQYEKE